VKQPVHVPHTEIAGLEASEMNERPPVNYPDCSRFPLQHVPAPKFLYDAICVHGGDRAGGGKVGLGKRGGKPEILRQANGSETDRNFTDQMGYTSKRIPRAEIDDPVSQA
jgi:hypothetical protein